MVLHKDIAITNMHHPYNWIYADTSTREAATGFTSDDIGGFAFQEDDFSIWVLTDDSPVTWSEVGSGGGGTPGGSDTQIQYNDAGTFAGSDKLSWTEGVDETDSFLNVDGSLICYSALVATNIGTPSVQSSGALNLQMVDELTINGDEGTSGQILQSNGAGNPPTWEDAPSGSSYTDEQVRDVIATAMQDSSSIDYTNTDGSDTMTMEVRYAGSSGLYGTAATAARSDHLHAGPYNIHWTMDEGGVPALNHKAWFRVPFAHTITSWTLLSNNAAGSCSLDVWRDNYSNFPPDASDTICGGSKPALSSSQKATSSSLGAWSTTGAADDIYTINLESADTMTLLSFILTITRTA